MKVSVVVPFHRRDKWLEGCVYSLEHQTYKDIEILLIDDTDNNNKLYEYGARQKGLEQATGQIILQTDSDAVYPNNFVENMVKYLLDTQGIHGVEQGYITPIERNSIAGRYAKYRRHASYNLKLNGKKQLYGGTMYYVEAKMKARYRNLMCGTDTDFVEQLKEKGWKFGWCKEAFFYHNDPTDLVGLFKRMYFYYHHAGKEKAKKDKLYVVKRLVAVLFPWLLIFAGERLEQYRIAVGKGDWYGIVSILIGNYIMDMASIGYFMR